MTAPLDFKELKALRLLLLDLRKYHAAALAHYHDPTSNGFHHRYDDRKPGDFSKASTATCVSSLIASSTWEGGPWHTRAAALSNALLARRWASAKLPKNNPFTVAFILEAVTALDDIAQPKWTPRRRRRVRLAENILELALKSGAASIEDYPPSAYLTQLVTRVLRTRKALPRRLATRIAAWAWDEIDHQLGLLTAKSPTADVFQLAYSIVLVSSLTTQDRSTPDQSAILNAALEQLFKQQLPGGGWPRSRPLFHYPGVGSAYCFEYEMLVQLLRETNLREKLLPYMANLSIAAFALRGAAFKIGDRALGWTSGHHPQLQGPESWSTASVYHFAYELERLTAEAIRRALFDYLNLAYTEPQEPRTRRRDFAPTFLDCRVLVDGRRASLQRTIFDRFVAPVAAEAGQISAGGQLSARTPMSAIFFGPPGTSKTEMTKQISEFLRWPHVTIDPSHFIRNGMDQLQTEADKIFDMLAVAERIVVLLDEIDEMVRARDQAPELLSRFLTTAMLPKLATINKHRKIVFIVATNYIDNFDFAISRPGRFDMIVQIMPPMTSAKLRRWPKVRTTLHRVGVQLDSDLQRKLADLTYDEFNGFQGKLQSLGTRSDVQKLIAAAVNGCTLNLDVERNAKKKWRDACKEQSGRTRLFL